MELRCELTFGDAAKRQKVPEGIVKVAGTEGGAAQPKNSAISPFINGGAGAIRVALHFALLGHVGTAAMAGEAEAPSAIKRQPALSFRRVLRKKND